MELRDRAFYDQFGKNQTARVVWFHSPEEYVDFLENPTVAHSHIDETRSMHKRNYASDWKGKGYEDCVDLMRFGDSSRAILAEKIYDEVIASDIITIGRPEIVPAVVGTIPNVPAVIAGLPETMLVRDISDAFSASAPIRMFIDCGISQGVKLPELIKRGVAALAFTMVMKQIRPIELYAVIGYLPTNEPVFGWNDYRKDKAAAIIAVRVETNPLDLARATWILTDPGFARRLAFPVSTYILNDFLKCSPDTDKNIVWAFNSNPTDDKYVNKMREILGLNRQDIYIKGGYLNDTLMLNQPVKWINKMILENKELSETDGIKYAKVI